MSKEEYHNTSLAPFEAENYEKALKNFVLFSKINNKITIILHIKYTNISYDFLSKQDYPYKIKFVDDLSFEKLQNRFLELNADKQIEDIQKAHEETKLEDDFDINDFLQTNSDILSSQDSAPIIKFVNSLFYQAIKKKSSDIHIEMHEFKGEIRYRINGVLQKHIELDKNIMALVVSRIKVISNLDISEKRIPQDGRTQVKISAKTLDIRVSVLPTFYGERIVMRILMQSEDIPKLEKLGFSQECTQNLAKLVQNSYGMILVTGPTGSGKSTTLHSLLQQVLSPQKNIITIEDPVEYKSDKINQIQANPKVGLTFASGLRSILRQDPDIVMLGEIRDYETASIAVQAALTGHLLFSTLHTNRASASIMRLVDMGIEKFLISSALLGVLAQRLVRILCEDCKKEDKLASAYSKDFALKEHHKIYKAGACKKCDFTGYSSRIAIGELFVLSDKIKASIKDNVDDDKLLKLALADGMTPLNEQLKALVQDGKTSFEEALRIGIKD